MLFRSAQAAGLGADLVVQMAYGDSGKTTFFIKSAADWDQAAANHAVAIEELKVMRRIRNRALAAEAVITRHGTLVGPIMADLTGHSELTPYKGGWCGNDVFPNVLTRDQRKRVRTLTQNLGDLASLRTFAEREPASAHESFSVFLGR